MTDPALPPPDERAVLDGLSVIPAEDRVLLKSLGVDLAAACRAYSYGRLRGRSDAYAAISNLPSVFGAERLDYRATPIAKQDGPTYEELEAEICANGDAA